MANRLLSVATLVSSVLVTFVPTIAFAQTKITVGVAAMSPRTIPLLIAQEQGLFAKHGIDARIVLIKGAPTLVASLISGLFFWAGAQRIDSVVSDVHQRLHSGHQVSLHCEL